MVQEIPIFGPATRLLRPALAARKASSVRELENIAAQVLILGDLGKLFGHVSGVDLHVFLLQLGSFKGDFVKHALENGMQAARADVFGLLVDHYGEARQAGDGIVAEGELDPLGFQQGDVLLD
jgi:hypothetical protein